MSEPAAARRFASLDIARAIALAGMFAYHLSWDLAYFGFVAPGLPFTPGLRALSHSVAAGFLGLTGVSLAIAHSGGFRARAFLSRLGRIVAAAALVSLTTYLAAPQTPIFFGILHCIAVSALVCAPFLSASPLLTLAVGAVAVAAPLLIQSAALDSPALIWLGLGDAQPATLDWRPLLPWVGAALIGLGAARLALARGWAPISAQAPAPAAQALAVAGRHSLTIYLVHQPILLGLLFLLAQASGVSDMREREAYLRSCRPACVEAGGEIDACAKACACVAARAGSAGLLSKLVSRVVGDAEKTQLTQMVQACATE